MRRLGTWAATAMVVTQVVGVGIIGPAVLATGIPVSFAVIRRPDPSHLDTAQTAHRSTR